MVLDVGGTTSSSRWVTAGALRDVDWINGSRALLGKHAKAVLHGWRTR